MLSRREVRNERGEEMRYSPGRKLKFVSTYQSEGKWCYDYLDDWGVLTLGGRFASQEDALSHWESLEANLNKEKK